MFFFSYAVVDDVPRWEWDKLLFIDMREWEAPEGFFLAEHLVSGVLREAVVTRGPAYSIYAPVKVEKNGRRVFWHLSDVEIDGRRHPAPGHRNWVTKLLDKRRESDRGFPYIITVR
jgi:hypothetical protein